MPQQQYSNDQTNPNTDGNLIRGQPNRVDGPPSRYVLSKRAVEIGSTIYDTRIQSHNWPLNCIKCNKPTSNMEEFKNHALDHWLIDNLCPVCNTSVTSSKTNFKQHLMIHTGEKPYECHKCQKSYRQKCRFLKHTCATYPMDNIR